jgi:predicted transcriptional regulator
MMTSHSLALDVVRKHQATIPVDVWAIARELGIEVREVPLPKNVSGKIKNLGGSPQQFSIWLNASHHTNRKRFTLAHELAHYLLHRNEFVEITDNTLFRQDGGTLDDAKERQANQMAANILMPYPQIKVQPRHVRNDLNALSRYFGVSLDAMRIRMEQSRPRQGYELEEEDEY